MNAYYIIPISHLPNSHLTFGFETALGLGKQLELGRLDLGPGLNKIFSIENGLCECSRGSVAPPPGSDPEDGFYGEWSDWSECPLLCRLSKANVLFIIIQSSF